MPAGMLTLGASACIGGIRGSASCHTLALLNCKLEVFRTCDMAIATDLQTLGS